MPTKRPKKSTVKSAHADAIVKTQWLKERAQELRKIALVVARRRKIAK